MSVPAAPLPPPDQRIFALVSPSATCPGCDAEAGIQQPAGYTSRHCARHFEELQRQLLMLQVQRTQRAVDQQQEGQVAQ